VIVVGRASSPVGFSSEKSGSTNPEELAFKPRTKKLIGEIGLIHEVARTTQCERLILTGLRGQSASLFDKFPSRRPHNIKKLWFSKALLRMMINPRGEHAPQYLGLFQVLTFAFCN
jgi:hypothetical protein